MLCFVLVLRGCVWYVCCYIWKMLFSSVLAITDRRDMGLYDVPLSMFLLGFGMGTMLANFHSVWYYVGVKSSFQHAREECESKRAYVF